jgi:hypothetical protein
MSARQLPDDDPHEGRPVPEDVTMLRWFFALPEPLPFSNGWTVTERISDKPSESRVEDPMVTAIFWQVSSEHGRIRGGLQAVLDVVSKAPGIPRAPTGRVDSPIDFKPPATNYTIVEAFTVSESPDGYPSDWTGFGGDLLPRADPLNRCLRLVNDLARAYRLTSKVPYGLPTYERIPQPILVYKALARRDWVADHQDDGKILWNEQLRTTDRWSGPSMFLLDHLNTADIVSGPGIEGDRVGEFAHWMSEIRRGMPFVPWRERLIEADRALHIHGEYAQAVTLTQTACEVFLDTLLSLLLWEEHVTPSNAAQLLEEGKVVRRIKAELQSRLGGNWQLEGKGDVARWFQQTARLRNRVVHGGYLPSRLEAENAYGTALPLEKFAFGRLVEKRNKYPRATLMTIAQSGLERRGLWRGRIRNFAEQVAPSEPDWRQQVREYRSQIGLAMS